MGLSGLIVREIVKKPDERGLVLGTTFILKLVGMSVGYVGLLIYGSIHEGINSIEFLLIVIAGSTLILSCFDVIDYWFQLFVQSKYVSLANLVGLSVSSVTKLLFMFFGLSLTFFISANFFKQLHLAQFYYSFTY